MEAMAHIKTFDHMGITVADLDLFTAFFVGLSLERRSMSGSERAQALAPSARRSPRC